jgi:tRNA dimethylallyltransferase
MDEIDIAAAMALLEGRRPRAVLIAGPTASGKSALALALAERLGGTIVNADSMQIYRDLKVLSARPGAAEEGRAPHRLYGVAGIDDDWSVGRWQAALAPVLADIAAQGQVAIVVGGTGLYFRALTEGLVEVPAIPHEIRARVRAINDPAELLARLAVLDPAMAGMLSPSDSARLARALEVVEATGRSLADWQRDEAAPPLVSPAEAVRLVIAPDRATLHARIGRRLEAMVEAGAVEEVRALLDMGLTPPARGPARGILKAIGIRPFAEYLAGMLGLAEAIEQAKAETRQYAKRQETWFRNQMADWHRIW